MCPRNSAKAKLRRGGVVEKVLVCPVEKGSTKALSQVVREDDGAVAPEKRGELIWFQETNRPSRHLWGI
eukprot:8054241-Prorocentrum_lima.AAC.1